MLPTYPITQTLITRHILRIRIEFKPELVGGTEEKYTGDRCIDNRLYDGRNKKKRTMFRV